ncbi:MAG: molybdopterin-dependent oxidoreductase [Anaerolineales bacterium]
MAKLVNIKIDGITVTVPEGTPVVDAAKKAGIDIPVFCYHPKMEPVGMCRQCLVEIGRPMMDRATGKAVLEADGSPKIQFMPKLETACTNTAAEGMVILTNTPKVKAAQKEVLELLLTSHPLDCPVCDKGGECPLQNLTMAHGPNDSRFLYDEKQRLDKRVPLGDLIFLDRERCIQCARCIRFQDDIAGEPVLAFHERGRRTDVVTFSEPGFDSIFSGNTTDICPVGALTTADFRFGARPWELNNAASVCSQCAVGCNITFNVRREAKAGGGYVIKRVLPRQNEQVNEIWMCDKGRFAGYHYTESDSRLMLDAARFESTLSRAADELAAAKADAVVLAGGRLSNEDLFNLKQLAAALGAQTYFYSGMGGGEYTTAYGLSAGSNLGALTKGDTILVVASDLYNEAPIWHLRVKAAATPALPKDTGTGVAGGARERGATVIVAAGRATKLDQFATSVVRYAYGDEIDAVKKLAGNEAIVNAANLVVFFGSDGLGLTGTQNLAAACAELVKGRAGKVNNGLVGVWPTPNAQGAWELGFHPAVGLATTLKGKTVYVVAADPAGDDPQLAEALKSAKTVIAQDILETETTRLASIVLPATAYTEREGTYTSAERRVQRFNPAVPARLGARADYAITAAIAKKCGVELEGRSPLLVMNRIAASEPAFAGISYAKLAEVSEQWPLVGRGDLYYGGTSYENTQGLGAHLALSAVLPAAGVANRVFPKGELVAVPATKLYDAGATVRPAKLLESHIGPAGVVLNPATARKFGVGNGEKVTVSLNNVEAGAEVKLDESLSDGVMLIYRSFGIPIFEPVLASLKTAEKAIA